MQTIVYTSDLQNKTRFISIFDLLRSQETEAIKKDYFFDEDSGIVTTEYIHFVSRE